MKPTKAHLSARNLLRVGASLVFVLGMATMAGAFPNRFPPVAGGIRVENHLLPAVSTGPLDPTWSPDGQWIAFSMRGDIWKVPATGGTALALTHGPAYHFEPAWSPDGQSLALSVDNDGNLDIGVVEAVGGALPSSRPIHTWTWSPPGVPTERTSISSPAAIATWISIAFT